MVKILWMDYDGVCADIAIHAMFQSLCSKVGVVEALAYYAVSTMWDVILPLNIKILFEALCYKAMGWKVILFTNRFPNQKANIIRNLGVWSWMFSDYIFGCGYKSNIELNGGMLWDDDPKGANQKGIEKFRLIPAYRGAWKKVVRVFIAAVMSRAYMSTRITPNKALDWWYHENIMLGRVRASRLGGVLNPTAYQIMGWTDAQYMRMWRTVIRLMALLGKAMVSYEEDLIASRGCKEERALAQKLGMPIEVK